MNKRSQARDFIMHCTYMDSIQYLLKTVKEVEVKQEMLHSFQYQALSNLQGDPKEYALISLVNSALAFGIGILEERKAELREEMKYEENSRFETLLEAVGDIEFEFQDCLKAGHLLEAEESLNDIEHLLSRLFKISEEAYRKRRDELRGEA